MTLSACEHSRQAVSCRHGLQLPTREDLMRARRFGCIGLLALGMATAGCAGGRSSGAILTAAQRLDATEGPPLLEPPAPGRIAADRNADGALDPDEWLTWEWSGVLRREDRNLDGQVSGPEWLAAKCEFNLPFADVCARFQTKQFRRLDRNRDHEVVRAEWSVVSMSWFRQNDHNRDCRISPPARESRGLPGPAWPCRPRPRQ